MKFTRILALSVMGFALCGMPAQAAESGDMETKPFVTLLAPGRCYKTWFTTTLIK